MKPFIRWVGGKTKLLPEIRKRIPSDIVNYFEPFIGGGAVLLDLDPSIPAFVGDSNWELINFYNVLKEQPEDLIALFRTFVNEKDEYYNIRGWDRLPEFEAFSKLQRAARFLYLNKTSFQGLWRVNSKGQHNVPFANRKHAGVQEIDVMPVAARLQNVTFFCEDFETVIDRAKMGDFVYVDPPYIPVDSTKAFVGYTDDLFHYSDQLRLRDVLMKAHERGVRFLASNSDTDIAWDLYQNFTIETVSIKRTVAPNNESRGRFNELLIRNF